MIKKTKRAKRRPSYVVSSFEKGGLIQFTDRNTLSTPVPTSSHEKDVNHTSPAATKTKKSAVALTDRRRLQSLDVFLNNCLKLAGNVETKGAASIVQSLREAKAQIKAILAK